MREAFAPSGLITLITDFGHRDPFVGVMKGVILSRFEPARIVDLTHEIRAHRPAEAGFWLARSFEYFPRGTVHVAVVDPGVGTERDILCLHARGHVLLAPDNGLLDEIRRRCEDAVAVRLAAQRLAELGVHRTSATFHGRDIFAPLAAELAAGRCVPDSLGPVAEPDDALRVGRPANATGPITGEVVAIDHFGNLITNIESQWLERFEAPQVLLGTQALPVLKTYGQVAPGEPLALAGSFGVLEIACREASAAVSLGVTYGARVSVRERTHRLAPGKASAARTAPVGGARPRQRAKVPRRGKLGRRR